MSDVPHGPPRIAFGDLECLLVLMEELHFPRAAERLGMTQSAVVQTIRRLEAELDVPLVNRRSPGITATEAGLRFADAVRPLIGGLAMATAQARRACAAAATLRLGCVPDLPLQHVLGFLGGLRAAHAELDVDVASLRTSEQLRRLREGALDLGLVRHAGEGGGIDVAPAFAGEPVAAFLPFGHRLAAQEAIGPGDLEDEMVVLPPREADPAVDERVLRLLAIAGHRHRRVRRITGDDARSLLLAVADEHGVAIAPSSLAESAGTVISLVSVRPLAPVVRMPDTALAWRADPPRALRDIVERARELAGTLFAQQRDGQVR